MQKKSAEVNESTRDLPSKHSTTSSSSSFSLKVLLSSADKKKIAEMFDALDPTKCWYLEATARRAEKENRRPWPVESVTPLLLLNTRPSLTRYFNAEELKELEQFGQPVLGGLPNEIKANLAELKKLKTPMEAFKYSRSMDYYPIEQPLLTWLSQTIESTSKFFIPGALTKIDKFLESDRQYYLWGFVNTIFKLRHWEKASTGNAAAQNAKRMLSAADEIERVKVGRRIDTIYVENGIELGGLESGAEFDSTKEFEDSRMKLPNVLKDMILQIVNRRPTLLHKAHVVGYTLNGNQMVLLDTDILSGYVTRIRRTLELEYPTDDEDYLTKLILLLELSAQGKEIMEKTWKLCNCCTKQDSIKKRR